MKNFVFSVLLSMVCSVLYAQELPKYEMRGTWIATVANLDWPTSRGTNAGRFQRDELIGYFNKLQEAGINAVFFQVRSECDAMYASNYEPWSSYLTGTEGAAPDPFWDPLAFAIQEAHKRGMELHAWLNPYRAIRTLSKDAPSANFSNAEWASLATASSDYHDFPVINRAENHVSVLHPEWILEIGNIAILNPGLDEVKQYITDVVMDIVTRYDVDGIHFDDYFYPYAPNTITDEDAETFAENPRGFTNIGDWRRDNVNTMVKMVHDSIKSVKPHVKFGISPFGKYSDGYNTLYADAYAWVAGEYLDYLVPQLYWELSRFYSGTAFQYLYDTWFANRNNRHVYAGHGIYRADSRTFSGTLFSASEVPNQIRYVRSKQDSTGSLHFRMRNITSYPSGNFFEQLKSELYKYPALTPPMYWLSLDKPPTPTNFTVQKDDSQQNLVHLSWSRPTFENGNDTTLKFAIYSYVSSEALSSVDTIFNNSRYLIAVTGDTTYTHNAPGGDGETYYFITSVSSNSVESERSAIVSAGVITSNQNDILSNRPTTITLEQNFPNPFNPETTIRFQLPEAATVSLIVYNVLGQPVSQLIQSTRLNAGSHQISFKAEQLPSGMYFYRLISGSTSVTKKMLLIK